MSKIKEACAVLGIKRVSMVPGGLRRENFSETLIESVKGKEMWFGPNGEVLGFYTEDEGLAALGRVIAYVDSGRTGDSGNGR